MHSYILSLFSMVCGALEAFCVQGLYLLWLKYQSKTAGFFTQAQVNTYPLGIQAVGIVSNLMAAVYIDATGRRVPMGILACALQLASTVILIIPEVPFAATMFAFYCAGTSYIVNPLLFGWANIILQRGGDDALRSVVLAAMNAASQILYVWWGIVLYPADEVPYWQKGSIGMLVVISLLLALLWVVHWVSLRSAPLGSSIANTIGLSLTSTHWRNTLMRPLLNRKTQVTRCNKAFRSRRRRRNSFKRGRPLMRSALIYLVKVVSIMLVDIPETALEQITDMSGQE